MEILLWIIVAIAVIAIDFLTSSFIFMWFSIGAIGAMILSVFGAPLYIQFIMFIVIGLLALSIGYKWAKEKFNANINHTPTMEQTYIGKIMIAKDDIEEMSKIKVSGIYWTAYNKGPKIKAGDSFIITAIEGNKLVVNLKED